jgi:hypothetical protein
VVEGARIDLATSRGERVLAQRQNMKASRPPRRRRLDQDTFERTTFPSAHFLPQDRHWIVTTALTGAAVVASMAKAAIFRQDRQSAGKGETSFRPPTPSG